ncbi:3-oxoacid CoA-transferase subunit B [Melghirimyces thermohalophilus]|uniref:3-oxoacid CoA-transferase subunit B n=1 Tax=Melghirimyces thermohalophilus TaxID=1236220 RepID=A0A1G6ITR5_9BACL|nr:3-oxoacid CoA-transferase subunit B [Melghirimyces thermohalophilus]SDC09166.1 3-oxoacid CoA-transferase subunit B [Melghirimyces thermohalophilus]
MEHQLIRRRIARRAAQELRDGDVVNLGIGIPTLVNNELSPGVNIHLHTENGMMEVGPSPPPEAADPQLINASRQLISELPGSSYFDSGLSFAMMRGGHLDVTIIGALQVSQRGDLASWAVPGKTVLGVGGAMDLVVGAKRVIVATTHRTKEGQPKLLPECTLPLTARGEVDVLVTEHAVFRFEANCMILTEIGSHLSLRELKAITPAEFQVHPQLKVVNRKEVFQ